MSTEGDATAVPLAEEFSTFDATNRHGCEAYLIKQPGDNSKSAAEKLGGLSLTCREAARLQSKALDHPLRLRQRVGLRIHLFPMQVVPPLRQAIASLAPRRSRTFHRIDGGRAATSFRRSA